MAPSRRKRAVLIGVPLAFCASLLACNNIIGLTDFTKGECNNARCDGTEGGLDQFVPDSPTEGGPDGGFDAQGAPPAVWAQWHMPNYGEGGAGEPPFPLDYGDAGTIVTDKVTGLNWQSDAVGPVTPSQADARCASTYGAGWRGPKRIELVTLLDYAHGKPYVDASRFAIATSGETIGTTSPTRNVDQTLGDSFYAVDFGTGAVTTIKGTATARVLCLRGK